MAVQAGAPSQVELSDTGVTYYRSDGITRTVVWNDLHAVFIATTDEGPFDEDVWWILVDSDGQCLIPQDASGEEELFLRLQALPGFDNEAFIAAMGSVENRQFLCWQRPSAGNVR
ncbi:MAG: hypothetical protein IT328_20825 [Caldilineaceae bacterium]|nr:hypothetical protein [Caldilineaceae bacterium]